MVLDAVPDHQCQVFAGRVAANKLRDIIVEAFVVKNLHDVLLNDGVQRFEVKQHPGYRIRLARNRYLDSIVMTMATLMVTLAKNRDVFCIGQPGSMKTVGCCKVDAARE